MCMEDIKLGRQTVPQNTSRSVVNGGTLDVPANGRRVGLLISTSATGPVHIHTGAVATPTYLLTMPPERPNYLFRVEEHGMLPTLGFQVINNSGQTVNMSYTEFTLLENANNIK